MLKFGNKEFRNLEEQVDKNKQDIADLTAGISAAIGYMPTILGVYARFDEIPTGGYNTGDTFLVGSGTPYSVYVYTDKNQWVNVGQFPVAGPKGDKGDLGSVITAAAGSPQVTPESLNDFYIDTITGDWYVASRTVSGSLVYIKSFSLKGEKGDRGERGLAGDIGPTGPTGPKGEAGIKGDAGVSAGFGTVSATIDSNVGVPAVEVTTSGDDIAKNFEFTFKNLKGDKGKDGAPGKDGASAYEVWKKLSGNEEKSEEDFIASLKGETGAIGPKGDIGPNGEQGLIGPTGPQGVKGDIGAIGPTGPKGDTGIKGD